ncbi:MAG: aldo/keto reductase [Candidatus Latescibacterota bacterium]|nr:MAG: aldo/keto reductase [Candidatus Latescibacterota bacterium]RKY70546.1 MAG: aldo/keto reductase [Candidatus Latescibacterota bacterium]
MQYRPYGNTGIKVSVLGFGAMRLPNKEDGTCDYEKSIPLLRRGLDLGINYIDSAWGYLNGTSEIAVGRAIKGYDRKKLYLATKAPVDVEEQGRADTWWRMLEACLERLDSEWIDFMHFHNIAWDRFKKWVAVPGGALEAAHRALDRGLIRYLCFSSHDTPDNIRKLIDTGEFSGLLVQYNLLDRSNEEVIAYAHNKGMGVEIMGPVGGGRLGVPSPEIQRMIPGGPKSTPEIALRFVLANPNVSVALSGMNELKQVEENAATASRQEPLSQKELAQIKAALDENERLAELYCTGCGYCMPCPNGVDIPENFRLMNYHRIYGLTEYAQERYAQLGQKRNPRGEIQPAWAAACVECGQCEAKCPQNIRIIQQLKEVHQALGS